MVRRKPSTVKPLSHANIAEKIREVAHIHRAGRLEEAVTIYRRHLCNDQK